MTTLLTTKDVAEWANVSRDYVRQAIHATDKYAYPPPLKAARVGRQFRIPVQEAERWISELVDRSPA